MTWFYPKMPFPLRVQLLFGSLSPSKFGDKISSFAELGCLSRNLNPESKCFPDPRFEFFPSQVLDPGCISKKLSILTKKMVSRLSEIWSRFSIPDPDPGSESWLFTYPRSWYWIPDPNPGIKRATDPWSRIQDPYSEHWRFRVCSGCRG